MATVFAEPKAQLHLLQKATSLRPEEGRGVGVDGLAGLWAGGGDGCVWGAGGGGLAALRMHISCAARWIQLCAPVTAPLA